MRRRDFCKDRGTPGRCEQSSASANVGGCTRPFVGGLAPRSCFTFNLRSRFWLEGQTEEIPDLSTLLLASLLPLRTRKLRPW
jgi:hypothetical protein